MKISLDLEFQIFIFSTWHMAITINVSLEKALKIEEPDSSAIK